MEQRRLGSTDLDLSVIGFGAWAIGGGDYEFGWGPQDDDESIAAIHRSLDLGINWIDTAPVYGMGRSEEVVAKALKGIRNEVIVATKCGLVWNEQREISGDISADSIRREIDASLRRLATDHIDLYQIHWPDPEEQIEEAWEALVEIKQAGKVRHIAVSNYNAAQMDRAAAIHPVASLQPPYSMLNRDIEKEQVPYCVEHKIGIVAYSPLQNGLLTGKFTAESIAALDDTDFRKSRNRHFQPPALEANLQAVADLKPIADDCGLTLAQLALAWVLRLPEVTSAITGTRKPAQIEETAAAAGRTLDEATLGRIAEVLERRDHAIGNPG